MNFAGPEVVVLGLSIVGNKIVGRRIIRREQLDFDRIQWVAVLEPQLHALFKDAASRLAGAIPPGTRGAVVLVKRMEPPRWVARFDGPALSFICSTPVFRSLLALESRQPFQRLSFALLNAIMNERIDVDRLFVRQLPLWRSALPVPPEANTMALVMAHRGKVQHLRTALSFIAKAQAGRLVVRIGLDVDDPTEYLNLRAAHPEMRFFSAPAAPVGPYVIRQELANRCRAPFLVFHDSDDISCYDRFSALSAEMAKADCDLLGCHELRVDEVAKEVVVLRFPLDVSRRLKQGPAHLLWHPSSIIRRKAFADAGGFSTDRPIANDTQFLLRAFFKMRIRNLDGFHYIRRKHPEALTVAAATGLELPLRRQLNKMWNDHFEQVRLGRLTLEQSSLRPIAAKVKQRLLPLDLERHA